MVEQEQGIVVEVVHLDERVADLAYGSDGAAAVDLRACSVLSTSNGPGAAVPMVDPWRLLPGEKIKVGTGVAVHLGGALEDGRQIDNDTLSFASIILPRSGVGSRGIRLSNTIGLIDSDYQGQLILALENASTEVFVIEPLMRIAQMVVMPVIKPRFKRVTAFTAASARGAGGFGSTGVR